MDDQKREKKGQILPVEEPRVRAIFSELFEDTRVVTFSQDGKETKQPLIEVFKSFVANRPNIYRELSQHTPEPGETMDNPGDELDRITREYMAKHNVKVYTEAWKAILALPENADVKAAWARQQKQ